ncbi:hypothetical protein [Marinicellulosiphila megalodicopiae]|uniref:hypothetical protein n=1 Tax=Marinicellulosiphila megalodicopiae TaxID=2724896 RepID=UPI003BAE8B82
MSRLYSCYSHTELAARLQIEKKSGQASPQLLQEVASRGWLFRVVAVWERVKALVLIGFILYQLAIAVALGSDLWTRSQNDTISQFFGGAHLVLILLGVFAALTLWRRPQWGFWLTLVNFSLMMPVVEWGCYIWRYYDFVQWGGLHSSRVITFGEPTAFYYLAACPELKNQSVDYRYFPIFLILFLLIFRPVASPDSKRYSRPTLNFHAFFVLPIWSIVYRQWAMVVVLPITLGLALFVGDVVKLGGVFAVAILLGAYLSIVLLANKYALRKLAQRFGEVESVVGKFYRAQHRWRWVINSLTIGLAWYVFFVLVLLQTNFSPGVTVAEFEGAYRQALEYKKQNPERNSVPWNYADPDIMLCNAASEGRFDVLAKLNDLQPEIDDSQAYRLLGCAFESDIVPVVDYILTTMHGNPEALLASLDFGEHSSVLVHAVKKGAEKSVDYLLARNANGGFDTFKSNVNAFYAAVDDGEINMLKKLLPYISYDQINLSYPTQSYDHDINIRGNYLTIIFEDYKYHERGKHPYYKEWIKKTHLKLADLLMSEGLDPRRHRILADAPSKEFVVLAQRHYPIDFKRIDRFSKEHPFLYSVGISERHNGYINRLMMFSELGLDLCEIKPRTKGLLFELLDEVNFIGGYYPEREPEPEELDFIAFFKAKCGDEAWIPQLERD